MRQTRKGIKYKLTATASALVFLIASGAFFLNTVDAQTVRELEARLQSLLLTVAGLQQQLGALQGVAQTDGQSEDLVFSRNLSFGDESADVRNLQKMLNDNPKTQVAIRGSGSVGQETSYFGSLTHAAVIRFQELYVTDVLIPVGLSYGTGFVGPSTRAKLNSLLSETTSDARQVVEREQESAVEDSLPIGSLSFFSTDSDIVVLMYPSKYDVRPDDKITLSGLGFDPTGNTIMFGEQTISNLISFDGSQIRFTVPEVSPGRYGVAVSNTKGVSDTVILNVVSPDVERPAIESISPLSGFGATEVTITGNGFSRTANTVYTGYGDIENVPSSDGKTITIIVRPPNESGGEVFEELSDPVYNSATDTALGEEKPETIYSGSEDLWLYVENEGGISNSAIFKYFYDKEEILMLNVNM
ncbi:IPT/TIG domain-containing protein [Patescibacteria group bacterium]|nr:IPT/TIG domain-containing protein [Patescibacteria group bacterium]